jgi:hypothetical protein
VALTEFGIWASKRTLGEEGPEAARPLEELAGSRAAGAIPYFAPLAAALVA